MKKVLIVCFGVGLFVSFLTLDAQALSEFDGIKCGSDIPKLLIGRKTTDEKVVKTEKKYRSIGLKNLGGTMWTEPFFLSSWLICGDEHMLLLETRNKASYIADVLLVPHHSRSEPMFFGTCISKDKKVKDLIAILKNRAGRDNLPAGKAWTVDLKEKRFITVPTKGLTCPRKGIITKDGGL